MDTTIPRGELPSGEILCDDERLFFVHGAVIEKRNELSRLRDKGRGDFGTGFYTFALCGDDGERGLKRAQNRAVRMARDRSQQYPNVRPFIIYVYMTPGEFRSLSVGPPQDMSTEEIYRTYFPAATSDFEVMIGPCLKNAGRTIIEDLPVQYKFAHRGTRLLKTHLIRQVP